MQSTLINGPSGMTLAVGLVARLLPVKSGKNGRLILDVSAPQRVEGGLYLATWPPPDKGI